MPNLDFSSETERFLRRATRVYPQPVAYGCGRVLRSRSPQELVNAVLKAAEILTRYLAALGIASLAARESGEPDELGLDLSAVLSGPLSFGSFLEAARSLTQTSFDHPLRGQLRAGLAPKGKGKDKTPGATETNLLDLLELRNELGHDLSPVDHAKARAIVDERAPVTALIEACRGVEGLLGLPLFVIEEQRMIQKKLTVRWLLLMGESGDPEPTSVVAEAPLEHDLAPYIGYGSIALCLAPVFTWAVATRARNYQLFVVDAVNEASLRFKAVAADPVDTNGQQLEELQRVLRGHTRLAEPFSLEGGQSPMGYWFTARAAIEADLDRASGTIPWSALDQDTLLWYANRLDSAAEDPVRVISDRLLDGREAVEPKELRQLTILFGSEVDVRRTLKRPTLDLRARSSEEERWAERIETERNLLQSLRQAVDFFGHHVGIDGADVDRLNETAGTADYVAMREALVNLVIHQDYLDASAAAQVELTPQRALFFNPGHSLVSTEALLAGGKSQARNPLIARALRLIGFAELGGSGLREIHRLWRGEQRRPPRFDSDPEANSYTLTLDWRTVPVYFDKSWHERIGVHLSDNEAKVLNIAAGEDGVSVEEAASATGLLADDARLLTDRLEQQVLVSKSGDRFHLADHLRELIDEQSDGIEPREPEEGGTS